MAYTDSLFQLGMDLTRSSTAQKEDHGHSAELARDDRQDYFIERDGVRCAGTHLIIDLFGARRLDDLKHIKDTLRRWIKAGHFPDPAQIVKGKRFWTREQIENVGKVKG